MADELNKVPKYQIIESDLSDKILQGQYKTNEGLPSESQLQKMYNCSRVTVRQALNDLEYKGLVYKKQGSGTFVRGKEPVQRTAKILSFSEEMIKLGKKPHSIVNTFNILANAGSSISDLIGIDKNEPVYYIERTRFADDVPMMFERTFMSVNLCPELSIKVLNKSKYTFAKDCGLNISYSQQKISPIFPGDYIADCLKISSKQPILRADNTTYLDDGKIFDYTELYINTDVYQMNIYKTI